MKTVIIDFSDVVLQRDELVLVSHTSPGGGRNTVKHWVLQGQRPGDVVAALAASINGGVSEWNAGQFQASADAASLVIMCNENAGTVDISAQVEGPDKVEPVPVIVL